MLLDCIGSRHQILMEWNSNPQLHSYIIRKVMRKKGQIGIEALARLVGMSVKSLEEIGGLEGWLRHRNCQRRQRYRRQREKLKSFSLTIEYSKSDNLTVGGGGKRGKSGGLQDIGLRTAYHSIIGK
ncbi:hypothetical protein Dtox_1451 [Desulfofarcimen acetoxidans DSM 771]|uniref:Uncharacterized protein n=1 Tax=Desulfofarcimen acetoxidans (strain ATCC 49208 / DSM 771 / KCTC 5769 / VKM B-1644 / 5575) TaxID=485916 RepID=C8VVK4_DESAS|nr:hypothetical protein [Desulfofarcimen acetoxidans]ACV62319.1 hypothetical protein Dtox_1451 [Desulfofarcimen acetoxidans DSM 771]